MKAKQEQNNFQHINHSSILYKYNNQWKQDINLDEITYDEFLINDQQNTILPIPIIIERNLNIKPISNIQDNNQILQFLGSKYITQPILKNIQEVLNFFLSNTLLDACVNQINNLLKLIQKVDKSEDKFKQKKYNKNEIECYLGLQIQFGFIRLGQLDQYWTSRNWLKIKSENIMKNGRFLFFDTYFCLIFNNQSEQLQKEIYKLKSKLRSLCNPDQELILFKFDYKTYKAYYILDYHNNFVLDVLIIPNHINNQESNEKLINWIINFGNCNHIIYILFEFDFNFIQDLLDNQIYPVIIYNNNINQLLNNTQTNLYQLQDLYIIKENNQIIVFPIKKINQIQYKDTYLMLQNSINQKFQRILKYRSNFYYSSLQNSKQNYNQLRIEFEEYFEIMIYSSSFLPFVQSKYFSYELYRKEIAFTLLGQKGKEMKYEKNRQKLKEGSNYQDQSTNTNLLTFGLQEKYDSEYHSLYKQSEDEFFKFCLVCLKYDGLTKPHFRCIQCEQLLQQERIFLCPENCFEKFHKNPKEYIDTDLKQIIINENDYYSIYYPTEDDQQKKPQQQVNTVFSNIEQKQQKLITETPIKLTTLFQPSPSLLQPIITLDQQLQPHSQQKSIINYSQQLQTSLENLHISQNNEIEEEEGEGEEQIDVLSSQNDQQSSKQERKQQEQYISPLEIYITNLNKTAKIEQ